MRVMDISDSDSVYCARYCDQVPSRIKVPVLVATDIAARGTDIDQLAKAKKGHSGNRWKLSKHRSAAVAYGRQVVVSN